MSVNSKIYVSLTTIPARFKNIYPCINSLLNQLFLPTKIIINIPLKYNFRFEDSSMIIDEEIEEFKSHYLHTDLVYINRCLNDYGPGTKLLGLLELNISLDDSFIILVDDDVIYKNTLIQGFIPYMYVKSVASYCVYQYSNIIIGQGVDGFLIYGDLLKDFLKYYNIIKNEKYIKYQDDVFISFYFQLKGISINKVETSEIIYSNYNNCEALSDLNGSFSRDNVYKKCIYLLNKYSSKGAFQ